MNFRVRFLSDSEDARNMERVAAYVARMNGVSQVFPEFADSNDPVLKRIFNALLTDGLTIRQMKDKAWEIGGVDGVKDSYLMEAAI